MKELFSENQIQEAVSEIATRINLRQEHLESPVVFIGLLNGCFMFYTDLVKKLNFDTECEFIQVKSYTGVREQGEIKILKDISTELENKIVYIVDDLVDSGNTMKKVISLLKEKNPIHISVVTLLKRKSTQEMPVPHYNGLLLDEEWVIGYGTNDEDGSKRNYRNLLAI